MARLVLSIIMHACNCKELIGQHHIIWYVICGKRCKMCRETGCSVVYPLFTSGTSENTLMMYIVENGFELMETNKKYICQKIVKLLSSQKLLLPFLQVKVENVHKTKQNQTNPIKTYGLRVTHC